MIAKDNLQTLRLYIEWRLYMKTGGYYTLTSVCIFSILFSIHPKVVTRRNCLMIKSILTLLSFLYSYDLTFSFRGDNVRRN